MKLTSYSPDATMLREIFGHYPSGVVAVASEVNGSPEVLVASSFTVGVSMEPPLVMFAVQNSSTTWPHLRQGETIGISVLADEHSAICRQLAAKEKAGRFTGVETFKTEGGAVFIGGSSILLECKLYAEHPAGDHTVALFEVVALHSDRSVEPLLFHGSKFRQMIPH